MGRLARSVRLALAVALVASCGGSAFTTGGGADGGDDGTTSGLDGAGDGAAAGDSSSSGGPDASAIDTGAPGEASVADAPHDVAEEPPPATCTGASACVPAVPSGWSGPVELYAGSSPAPPCTTSFTSAYDGNADVSAPPAECTCSCGTSLTQCSSPTLTFYDAVCVGGAGCTCTGNGCYTTTLQAGACTTVSDMSACGKAGAPAMSASASVVAVGTCPPVSGKQAQPVTWGTYAQSCSSTVTIAPVDCPSGSVCAPKPAAPYGATLCISQAGNVVCPSVGYTSKQSFYGGVLDSRGCTACTCASPTGAGCAATIDAFTSSNGTCADMPDTYAAPFTCDPVNQPTDMRLVTTPQNGSCVASTVTSTGSATPVNQTTFCCLP